MYKKSKYSKQKNSELEFDTLDALMKYPGEYLTIEGIKASNGYSLGGITTQKMSRILSKLSDMGLVRKKKEKTTMTYTALAVMEDDGVRTPFETKDNPYENYTGNIQINSAVEINWELDVERNITQ